MRTREELAWAAGFFEGEGSFGRTKMVASIGQVDREPLERFLSAVGLGQIRGPYLPNRGQLHYRWHAHSFENVQALVAMLWPWLSARRRLQATICLQLWKRPARGQRPRALTCGRGHPRSEANTYVRSNGIFDCRVCRRELERVA